jgi:hypothetical protein
MSPLFKIFLVFIIAIYTILFIWKNKDNTIPLGVASPDIQNAQHIAMQNRQLHTQKNPPTDISDQKESIICKKGETLLSPDNNDVYDYCYEAKKGFYKAPFIKKNKQIYYKNISNDKLTLIENADADTFSTVAPCYNEKTPRSFYARDKNHVYLDSQKIDLIDASSFYYWNEFGDYDSGPKKISIFADKKNIYFNCQSAGNLVSRAYFRILGKGYSRDNKNAFYLDQPLVNADIKSLKAMSYQESDVLYGNFALDKNHVYYNGQILQGVDQKKCNRYGLGHCLPTNWLYLNNHSSL